MTIEETKEAIKVMQAFVDGKDVECSDSDSQMWKRILSPSWNFVDFKYRIKSEPYIRPYKGRNEFMNALKEHDGWLLSKNYYYATTPVYVDNCGIDITGGAGANENYGHESLTFKELLEQFTWMDGSACGIKEG